MSRPAAPPDHRAIDYCAIDFGTSNSAVAVADPATADGVRLVPLEGEHATMPTAVFYDVEDGSRRFGRAAVAAYVDGHEGRLLRSLKSILGSSLIDRTTPLGDGIVLKYRDVIGLFLKRLKEAAEADRGVPMRRVVLGRPVYFVDDDPAADRRAEEALADAARTVGFDDVSFQFEPIAAAQDYARRVDGERLVLVADIGGGTSDFTVVRVAGRRPQAVLANHGVHVAGTDFDQHVERDTILPYLGFGGRTPEGREVPNRVYHDLSTWHLIQGLYAPGRTAELAGMRWFYADAAHHRRLMKVIGARLGHRLLGRAEQAKIALSDVERVAIELADVDDDLAALLDRDGLVRSLARPLQAIVDAADETLRRAGVSRGDLHAIYFTGGSTGLRALSSRLSAVFPNAEPVFGDRFASVAAGLGLEAVARHGRTMSGA